MNIKYISLLALICVAGVNAINKGDKINKAKENLVACKKQQEVQPAWSKIIQGCIDCDREEHAFYNAKQELKDIIYPRGSREAFRAQQELQYESYVSIAKFEQSIEIILIDILSKKLGEHISNYSPDSEKSIEEYCNNALKDIIANCKYIKAEDYGTKTIPNLSKQDNTRFCIELKDEEISKANKILTRKMEDALDKSQHQ
jgi:hypothetical protein